MTRNRAKELYDALGAPTALDGDDERSFEQQMKDNNVEVAKPDIEWYKPAMARRNTGLKDKISINKSGITFGNKIIEKLEKDQSGSVFISIGIIKKKTRAGNVLAIKPVKNQGGFTITKTEKRSYRVGTKKLVRWLAERGIEQGVYELKEVEGGFIAVPEVR